MICRFITTTDIVTGVGGEILAIDHEAALRAFAPEAVVLVDLLGIAHGRSGLAAIGKPVE